MLLYEKHILYFCLFLFIFLYFIFVFFNDFVESRSIKDESSDRAYVI